MCQWLSRVARQERVWRIMVWASQRPWRSRQVSSRPLRPPCATPLLARQGWWKVHTPADGHTALPPHTWRPWVAWRGGACRDSAARWTGGRVGWTTAISRLNEFVAQRPERAGQPLAQRPERARQPCRPCKRGVFGPRAVAPAAERVLRCVGRCGPRHRAARWRCDSLLEWATLTPTVMGSSPAPPPRPPTSPEHVVVIFYVVVAE